MAKTVTVLLNSVRDITFDVTDTNGKVHKLTVKGSGSLIRNADGSVMKSAALPAVGAYGITTDVDADLWEAVKKEYGSMAIFEKGYIKATTPKDEAEAKAELSSKANGEEPVEPQEKKRGRKKASA